MQMWTTSTSSACTSSSELANARSMRELGRRLLGARRRGGRDADDVGAGEARGAGVDGADEAGAGDGDSKRCVHGRGTVWTFCVHVKQKIAVHTTEDLDFCRFVV